MSITSQTEKNMKNALEHLREELKKIRTGHANPAMVEDINVEVYGTNMRLKDIATISSPETKQLLITPFDANNTPVIGKSIEKANLGFSVITEGNMIRVNIPPMDESVRKEMVKLCHKKREECKISIRNVRQDSNQAVRKEKSEGNLPEDLLKKTEKEIQDLTDRFCKEADLVSQEKEKQVATI